MPYLLDFAGRPIFQTEQVSTKQVLNNAGGYTFKLDMWSRLERFLILGSEGGTYYCSEHDITKGNIDNILDCINNDGVRVVNIIVDVSVNAKAAKTDPALYALALCAKRGNELTRKSAFNIVNDVCRTGTHLYHFVNFVNNIGGWGRGTRNAVARWFNSKTPEDLAYQLVKYQSRDGWSARDVLRLCHAKPPSSAHDAVYKWVTDNNELNGEILPEIIEALEEVKLADNANTVASLINKANLPREAVPTKWLTEPIVWEALARKMPATAMIRNLATMTRIGLISDGSVWTDAICSKLRDSAWLKSSRVHPIQVLSAMIIYKNGRGVKSDKTWTPVSSIIDALDDAFYGTFDNVEPTGKHHVLALDVSGSMTQGEICGTPGLTPAIGACAMAMITAKIEKRFSCAGFGTTYRNLDISPRRRLDDNLIYTSNFNFGNTDCSLPMIDAQRNKADVDVFVVYTDNETNAGKIHPHIALENYRQFIGHDAKLIVVGMTATEFSIANPDDAEMMDVVGFDSSAPQVMAQFVSDKTRMGNTNV